jgi:hypothetical protein
VRGKTVYIFLFGIIAFLAVAGWVWIYNPFCLICPKRANPQASAMMSIRTLGTAEAKFQSDNGRYGTLHELVGDGHIDPVIATGVKNGYRFEIRLGEKEFEAYATPIKVATGATRSFYLSSPDWRIRGADKQGEKADADDRALE